MSHKSKEEEKAEADALIDEVFNPTPERMREIVRINRQNTEFLAKLAKADISPEELTSFIDLRFAELKNQYKQRMEDLFHELMLLANKPQAHLFKKTTYKVELTAPEWLSLQDRYLCDA